MFSLTRSGDGSGMWNRSYAHEICYENIICQYHLICITKNNEAFDANLSFATNNEASATAELFNNTLSFD